MHIICMGRRGRDRMVVGFTTTCAISAYHHQIFRIKPLSWRGVLSVLPTFQILLKRYQTKLTSKSILYLMKYSYFYSLRMLCYICDYYYYGHSVPVINILEYIKRM